MAENERGGNGTPSPESAATQEPGDGALMEQREATAPAATRNPTTPSSNETAPAPAEGAEQKVERMEKEKREVYDRMLRVAAEFENYKKRSRREADESEARGREKLAKEILPVLDNLDRALAALAQAEDSASVESLAQGVRLVDKQFHGVLEKFDIKRFDALGEPFDPAKHEAIQQMETWQFPSGAVARVFARGYMIGSRLLRPAMVAVAKAPPAVGGEEGNGAANPEDASAG